MDKDDKQHDTAVEVLEMRVDQVGETEAVTGAARYRNNKAKDR